MVSLPNKVDFWPCSQAQSDFLHVKPPKDCRYVFEILYSGAFGAGKSRAVCQKVAERAIDRKAKEGLTRKTFAALRQTTLKTLLESDGALPPVLPHGTYTHNQSKHVIQLHGGGQILYFGCDNEDYVRSMNLSGCGVDEATELSETQYKTVLSRIRTKTAAGLEMYMATNPDGRSHHLYSRFSIGDTAKRNPWTVAIQTSSRENDELPPEYLNTLDGFTGQFYERYVEGKWGNFEGMIYSGWDDDIHLLHDTPEGTCYAGIDEGFTNEFAIVVANQDSTENLHIHHEFCKSGLLQGEKVLICAELAEKHKVDCFYVDPSAAGLIEALRNAGLDAMRANHKVNDGIGKVQRRMAVNPKLGTPRLTVHPRCKHLRDEVQGYRWEQGKDKPHKEHDHAVDALRYLVASIDKGGLIDWEKALAAPARENPEVARLPRYRDVEPEEVEELTLARDSGALWLDSD